MAAIFSGSSRSMKWKSELGSALLVWHLTLANPVRVSDDLATSGLPEHFGEAHDRNDATRDQVMQHRARPDRRKLVYVSDQDQSGAARKGPHVREGRKIRFRRCER
jgi:hypothetical protein